MRAAVLITAVLLLAACGGSDNRTAGEITQDEADALDDAASMLEEDRLPPASPRPAPSAQPSAAPTG